MKKTIYTILLTLIIWSCGSRKVEKESLEKDSETKMESTSNTKELSSGISYTLEPVDLNRPMLVGKDTVYNTRYIYRKDTIVKNNNTTVYLEKKDSEKQDKKEVERDNTKLFLGIAVIAFLFLFLVIVYLNNSNSKKMITLMQNIKNNV